MNSVSIKNVEFHDEAYKLVSPSTSTEYFLVENRHRLGYDSYIQDEGLAIWHIDDTVGTFAANNVNGDETHKRVDLECADQDSTTDHVMDADDLDRCANRGDTTDLYPSEGNDDFCLSTYTTPSSIDYSGIETIIGVFNIGTPETTVTAHLWIAPEFINDTIHFPWDEFEPGGLAIADEISVTHEVNVSHLLPFCGRGAIIYQFMAPSGEPSGLTYAGPLLWNADAQSDMIYELDPVTGDVLRDFPAPGSEPRDLAWDGLNLWCVDADLQMIHQIDPATGGVIGSLQTPGPSPFGLTWIDDKLWCSDTQTDMLYELLTDGSIVRTIPSPGGEPRGLAFDGELLWLAEAETNMLYPIEVGPTSVAETPPVRPSAGLNLSSAPNPFRGQMTFSYAVRDLDDTHITLAVYDASGSRIRTLVDETRAPGTHFANWDGRSDAGDPLPSGIYFSKLEVGEISTIKKVILLR
jgi:hypothetical protein